MFTVEVDKITSDVIIKIDKMIDKLQAFHASIDPYYFDYSLGKHLRDFMIEDRTNVIIGYMDNLPVGYLTWSHVELEGIDHIRIENLFVESEYRGKHVGTKLMDTLKGLYSHLTIDVSTMNNPNGFKFYLKQGFIHTYTSWFIDIKRTKITGKPVKVVLDGDELNFYLDNRFLGNVKYYNPTNQLSLGRIDFSTTTYLDIVTGLLYLFPDTKQIFTGYTKEKERDKLETTLRHLNFKVLGYDLKYKK